MFYASMLPGRLFAQTYIQGAVIDEKTKEGIPYATLGIKKTNTGTNADEHGKYLIRVPDNNDDTIIISSVGYQTLKIALSNGMPDYIFSLKPKDVQMRNITISNKKDWTSETIGKFDDCGDYALVSSGYQTQIAKLFHSEHENTLLNRVTICHKPALLASSKSKYRIRIYDQDSITGQPSTELYDEPIEVSQTSKMVGVDLAQYRIWLPHKNFFVAIEWLKIPFNKEEKKNGNKNDQLETFYPRIGAKNSKSKNRETWGLTYRNSWFPMNGMEVSISAEIKY
jgi:hypothetical protein